MKLYCPKCEKKIEIDGKKLKEEMIEDDLSGDELAIIFSLKGGKCPTDNLRHGYIPEVDWTIKISKMIEEKQKLELNNKKILDTEKETEVSLKELEEKLIEKKKLLEQLKSEILKNNLSIEETDIEFENETGTKNINLYI